MNSSNRVQQQDQHIVGIDETSKMMIMIIMLTMRMRTTTLMLMKRKMMTKIMITNTPNPVDFIKFC